MKKAIGIFLLVFSTFATGITIALNAPYIASDWLCGLFVGVILLLGVPVAAYGARLADQADHPELSPVEFETRYQRETFGFAASLGCSLALGVVIIAPFIVRSTGLAPVSLWFCGVWSTTGLAILRYGCPWITRPLHKATVRVALRWYDRKTMASGN